MVEVVIKGKKEDKRQEVKEFTGKMEAMQEVEPYTADLMKIKDVVGTIADEAGLQRSYLLTWVFEQMCYFDETNTDFEIDEEPTEEEEED